MAELTAPMVTSAVRAAKLPSSAALGRGLPIWRSATSVAGTVSSRSGRNRTARDPNPSSSRVREEFTSTYPSGLRPAKRSTWWTRVGSMTIRQSGATTGSRVRIARSPSRQ